MNILLLGSGGREHALAWKMSQSPHCTQLFIAPGNAGTAACGKNINLGVNDFGAQKAFCITNNISMVVVGPEEPLVNGVYDFYAADPQLKSIKVIGPSAAAAQLEGSKAFSKLFMQRHHIPTASYAAFSASQYEAGKAYLSTHSLPVVLKADGLAAGKGVVICTTNEAAQEVFESMIVHRQFGNASSTVVVESFLSGIEVSVFVLTDGKDYKIIGHAKDYKRIGEGDTGPNTGGMGCVTPVPFADAAFLQKTEHRIIAPTVKGLHEENLDYKGFIFFGLMNVNGDPFLIEYNCRMGDPETEVVVPKLNNDLVELFLAVADGKIAQQVISADERACCTIMAVSGGYPGSYEKDKPIALERASVLSAAKNTLLFHAGTKETEQGIVTNGGRVLAVTAFGKTITEAAAQSKAVMSLIDFEGMYYRKDIGFEFA